MSTATREAPFTQIPDWVILNPQLSHATVRVYAAVCTRVGKERTAWPSLARIAEDANCSQSTVLSAIKSLERAGAIVTTPSVREDGSPGSNHYHLPMTPTIAVGGPPIVAGGSPNSRGRGSPNDRGGTIPTVLTTPIEQHQECEARKCEECWGSGFNTFDGQEPGDIPYNEECRNCHGTGTAPFEIEVIEIDGQPYNVEITSEILDGGKDHHDAIAYALVDAMGWKRTEVTEPQWGTVHKAALTLTNLGVHPAEIAVRAKVYQVNHPEWELTPLALAKWWADSSQARLKPSKTQVADLAAAAERRQWRKQ